MKKFQGAPDRLPDLVPSVAIIENMFEDDAANYRAFERWNQDQTKLDASIARTYQTVRDSFRAPLETLVDVLEAPIMSVDPRDCSVAADISCAEKSVLYWTLNGLPVSVTLVGERFRVDSDGLVLPGANWRVTA